MPSPSALQLSWATGVRFNTGRLMNKRITMPGSTAAGIDDLRRLQLGRCGGLRKRALLATGCCWESQKNMITFETQIQAASATAGVGRQGCEWAAVILGRARRAICRSSPQL